MTTPSLPTFDDVVAAARRIDSGVVRTPCVPSGALSELCGCEIWCKLDYQQPTGSFKERGARNTLMQLAGAARTNGVIAASAGNHALALAYHGRALGIPVTVVMPRSAPLVKQVRCREYGARVVIHGENIADARLRADELVATDGLHYVNGFNDHSIITGAGTCALEIFEQCPNPDAIVVPVGGGGLIAGVSLVASHLRPATEVIGVESIRCASMSAALAAGHPVRVAAQPSLADGLGVPEIGPLSFEIARGRIKQVVTVTEESITRAILRLAESEKGVVEGAGATPLAAFIQQKITHLAGRKVVLVLCGGNIDPTTLSRVIEHGLALEGRLIQFLAVIRDRPGGLADLATAIASTGASIKQVSHERAFGEADVSKVQVLCQIEVRGVAHSEEIFAALRAREIEVVARGGLREIATHEGYNAHCASSM
ncbi:MAG: pyridoxal-phosphate dependent enzyme [Phycisphaerales bacterium]|nr:pyridoxal-phosphate dependent enzyme [Phycisphaerales bacterium]